MDWFEILKKTRELASSNRDSAFKTKDLQTLIFPSTDSSPTKDKYTKQTQQTSAWICKFVKWGYVERVGSEDNPGHKPVTLYSLTEAGWLAENTSTDDSDLDKLRDAVRVFEGARNARRASMGKKSESKTAQEEEDKAFLELLALCDALDRKEFGVK